MQNSFSSGNLSFFALRFYETGIIETTYNKEQSGNRYDFQKEELNFVLYSNIISRQEDEKAHITLILNGLGYECYF